MNVAHDPWIPVVNNRGQVGKASLLQLFDRKSGLVDLVVRPHERVALMRLITCIAHAALDGPKDYSDWLSVPERLSQAAADYLTRWQAAFELFDPKMPWLQVAGLSGDSPAGVSILDFALASGSNSTLFDHHGQIPDRPVTPERAALTLLTYLCFAPCGGVPVASWEDVKPGQVGNPAGPCGAGSMLHTILRAETLFETIHLNLPTFERVVEKYRTIAAADSEDLCPGIGRPVWEQFPKSPKSDSPEALNATGTYLGRLVPISRWARFINDHQLLLANGFRYDFFQDGFPAEPTATVQEVNFTDKKGVAVSQLKVIRCTTDKAVWRELASLLGKRSAFGCGGPLAAENAPYDRAFDLHACGVVYSDAAVVCLLESVFHISPALHGNSTIYQAEIIFAEKIASRLGWAVETYRKEIDGSWEGRLKGDPKKARTLKALLQQTATSHYWTTVEDNLRLLLGHIEALGSDEAEGLRSEWRKSLYLAARDAYQLACGQLSPRQRRAFAIGWRGLTSKKTEADPSDDHQEVNEA